jgi:hypothetical protein
MFYTMSDGVKLRGWYNKNYGDDEYGREKKSKKDANYIIIGD